VGSVDTDVLVDHLRGARRFRAGRDRISYSFITRAELFAGRGADEERVRHLLAPFGEVGLDRSVAEIAGRIRRESAVALPDALIAATALKHGMTLLTRNRRDFQRVRRLRVRVPG
jgi:predicted nucleic acid-binding protein